MREINISSIIDLNNSDRVRSADLTIIEKVWINDPFKPGIAYSGCYIRKWWHLTPKLRLMTIDGEVKVKQKS